MVAHKGEPFSFICIEAGLDSQPWSKAWSLDMLPRGRTAPGSAEHTAVTLLQCPLHNAAHTPQPLQTQLCSGLVQHSTAQTCPCITISAVTALSQLGMSHWVSGVTYLRNQFRTQPEKSSTGFTNWGHLNLWRIWPTFYLANCYPHCKKPPNTKPKNLMRRDIWMESRHGY